MNVYDTREIDNRDSAQMYEYLEARIDVLKRRISELERVNQMLRLSRSEFHNSACGDKVTSHKVKPFIPSREASYDLSYAAGE